MSYRLLKFDGLTLSSKNMDADNLGEVDAPVLQVAGGWFDVHGIHQQQMRHSVIRQTMTYSGASMQTDINALRAKLGKRGFLTRQWKDESTTQQIEARLLRVSGQQSSNCSYHRLTAEFQLLRNVWLGALQNGVELDDPDAGWTLDDGIDLDENLTSYTGDNNVIIPLENDGNAEINYGSLTVKAVTTSITAIRVWQWGDAARGDTRLIDMQYNGTVAAGKEFVIQFALKTVRVNGTSVYDDFELLPAHRYPEWICIPPGGKQLRVNITSAGTAHETYFGTYRDAWY